MKILFRAFYYCAILNLPFSALSLDIESQAISGNSCLLGECPSRGSIFNHIRVWRRVAHDEKERVEFLYDYKHDFNWGAAPVENYSFDHDAAEQLPPDLIQDAIIVHMYDNESSKAMLEAFKRQKRLTYMEFNRCDLESNFLAALNDYAVLYRLSFVRCVLDKPFVKLSKLPVKCLEIEDGNLNDVFYGIEALHDLDEVSLSYCRLDRSDYLQLCKAPQLKRLSLCNLASLTSETLNLVGQIKTLEYLNIEDSARLSYGDWGSISQLKNLHTLVVENTALGDDDLATLNNMSQLRLVLLSNTGATIPPKRKFRFTVLGIES